MGSSERSWMTVAVIFIAISIALSGYLIYVKEFKDQSDSEGTLVSMNDTDVLELYPWFFRTVQTQATVERQYQAAMINSTRKPVPADRDHAPKTCSFSCQGQNKNDSDDTGRVTRSTRTLSRRSLPVHQHLTLNSVIHRLMRRQANSESFHGCCISSHLFVTPSSGETPSGQTVEILQFNKLKQYFPSQKCSHAQGCTGCTCVQETAFFPAIIKHSGSNKATIGYVQIPSCCKCLNTFPG